jgi:hypothetical protein
MLIMKDTISINLLTGSLLLKLIIKDPKEDSLDLIASILISCML